MFLGVMLVLKFIWSWVKRIIFFGLIASILSVLLFKFVMVPFTPLMISRAVGHVMDGHSPKLKKTWVSLQDMSKEMPLAAMCAEDGNFLNHHGFDFEAMEKAWKYNSKHGDKKPIKGGSTISQQVAKNVFLWQGRTYLRKGLEVYFTFLIELFWSKHRIMEVYLNVIEMGDGIYGAEAATQAYYNKSCKKLSRGEAALITVCFPNPRKYSPLAPNNRIYRRQQKIVRLMNYQGKIDWEQKD
jgi:monofunctional biosynthetic peptidoglycan transglycosylase